MTRKVTSQELRDREAAILKAMRGGRWRRPIDIATRAGLNLNATLATLLRLENHGKVRRKEYEITVQRGRYRKRTTTKPIVEYQRVKETKFSHWPAWLLAPGATPQCAP